MVFLNAQGVEEQLIENLKKWNAEHDAEKRTPDRYGLRTYGVGAQILRDLNVGKMRLLSLPRKMPNMAGYSLTVTGFESEN